MTHLSMPSLITQTCLLVHRRSHFIGIDTFPTFILFIFSESFVGLESKEFHGLTGNKSSTARINTYTPAIP
jgi:hypothetical protein